MDAMTKGRTYLLTALSAVLYVFLCWAFADGMFTGDWWDSDAIAESTLLTYLFLALIIAAGIYQAQQLPDEGIVTRPVSDVTTPGQVDDPVFWKLIVGNIYFSIIWLPLRFFVGQEWLAAGEHKLRDDAWMDGGTALQGYWERAVAIPEQGRPAITYDWFPKLVAIGEFAIGLGLIVGALVGIAAFFGTLLNFNFQLAGSASTNPVLFGLGVFLVLAWKVAGWWGLDRWLLPLLGTPWSPGRIVTHEEGPAIRPVRTTP
jgi:thiosulfate dehydrogenase [quinone] large subunit